MNYINLHIFIAGILFAIAMILLFFGLNGLITTRGQAQQIANYHSYTKGFACTCDVLIECDGRNMMNTSVVGFRWDETNNSRWCE